MTCRSRRAISARASSEQGGGSRRYDMDDRWMPAAARPPRALAFAALAACLIARDAQLTVAPPTPSRFLLATPAPHQHQQSDALSVLPGESESGAQPQPPANEGKKSRYAYLWEGGDAGEGKGRVSYQAPPPSVAEGRSHRDRPAAKSLGAGPGGKAQAAEQPAALAVEPGVPAEGGGAESGYVSAAKRDAMRKREWERNNLKSGDGGQVESCNLEPMKG